MDDIKPIIGLTIIGGLVGYLGASLFSRKVVKLSEQDFIRLKPYIDNWVINRPFPNPVQKGWLVDKHWRELDKNYLSVNPLLTPELIEKYWGEWNVCWLSRNPSLTPELIDKHWDELNGAYCYLSDNSSLTPETIKKHWGKWELERLLTNSAFTPELREHYKKSIERMRQAGFKREGKAHNKHMREERKRWKEGYYGRSW